MTTRWRCCVSWECRSARPRRRDGNATKIDDREGKAEAEVFRSQAQPLCALRPLTRVPAAVRALPNLLSRVGAFRNDSGSAQSKLVGNAQPTTLVHEMILH